MNLKKTILYGIGIWAFAFGVSILIFPFHEPERPLFESIMPVALVLAVVLATIRIFRPVHEQFVRTGIVVGLLWFFINIAIDAPLFFWGPLKMPMLEYVKDIGITYLLIPLIPIGVGYVLQGKHTPEPEHTVAST